MNTLSKEDALLFHKLFDSLLFNVNRKTGMIKNANTLEEFVDRDVQETLPLRKKIFSNASLFIDDYVRENPDRLTEDELKIVMAWKKFKTGKFFVIKHTKENSLFFNADDQKVYGVKGITDSIEEKFRGYAPILVDTTLIQFKEQIIYDGLLASYNISFGGGMKRSIKQESDEAIQKYGVILSFESNPVVKQQSDEELLRFYLKSTDNRNRYAEEINNIKAKSKELAAIFYQEEARYYSKPFKKTLNECGIEGHFAVLLHSVVASGRTEKELMENVARIVPEDKWAWVYTFKL